MGENDDGTEPRQEPRESDSNGNGEGEGQGQQESQQQQDMSEYVLKTEHQASMAAVAIEMADLRNSQRAAAPIKVMGAPGTEPKIIEGTAHKALVDVIANVAAGIHTYLVGPAGTGKTHLCLQVAEALDRQLDIVGAMLTKHEAVGYQDANGRYVSTAMRDAFEHGHVINWDEVDASSPAALVAVNAMLANDRYTFPDRTVERHPDFVVIACGNTYGTGADREYVGRMQLDAATLDRFAFIEIEYDEALDSQLGIAHYLANHADGDEAPTYPADAWIQRVQSVRAVVAERKLRHVVSPRATINGCKLIARGVAVDKVVAQVLVKGASDDVKAAIESV
jgi:MoxR-like ATPase